ncbi:MAG TPA: hypothetical protein VFW62_05425, partial [bacterium]|nr:hypothetical protein [bacterium]
NVRFFEGNLLENLPAELKADLIFACLPQVRMNQNVQGQGQGLREIADYYYGSEASYFDRFGLGLIERTLTQARGRLQPGGRILLNLGGRPGRAVLEDLVASQGFQPRVRFSRMIPQDAGTDISGLARQESQTGFRFEFFRPDNATESISAAEAMTIPNPHHMLYLMEGRPYPDLLRQGLEARLKEGGRLGYTANAGFENGILREGLARELSRDLGFRLTPEVLHLGPDADTVLEGLLRVLPTERGLLFAGNGADMPRPLEPFTPRLVAPNFAAIQMALGEANPSVLVLELPRDAWADRGSLNQLLRNSAERGIHTLVLEDQPMRLPNASHPLLEALSASLPAAEHTHLVHSLDRRYATPALPLAALVSGNRLL